MRSFLSVTGIAVCLGVSFSLSAQQTTPGSAATSNYLQSALVQLTGGNALEDITLSGTVRRIAGSDDETGTVVAAAIVSDASRIDCVFPSGPAVEIRNDSQAPPFGTWSGPDGVAHAMAFHNVLAEPVWFSPAIALVHALSATDYTFAYIGHETRGTQGVEHYSVWRNLPDPRNMSQIRTDISEFQIYLDSSNLLPVSMEFNIHPDNNAGLAIPVDVEFSDYQMVTGAQVPFQVQKYVNGSMVLVLQFESASINSGLPASQFAAQ